VDHLGSDTAVQGRLDVGHGCSRSDNRQLLLRVRGVGRESRKLEHGVRHIELGQRVEDLVAHPHQNLLLLGCVQRAGESPPSKRQSSVLGGADAAGHGDVEPPSGDEHVTDRNLARREDLAHPEAERHVLDDRGRVGIVDPTFEPRANAWHVRLEPAAVDAGVEPERVEDLNQDRRPGATRSGDDDLGFAHCARTVACRTGVCRRSSQSCCANS
jgi:hypothetical protein